jgi:curved DNA-binding protein CbpA
VKTPYEILGVSPNADDETIKRAYHELARKYHPDRYTNSDLADVAKEKMQEVNAAYEEIQREREAGAAGHDDYGRQQTSGNGPQNGGKTYDYGNAGAGNYHSRNYSPEAREKFILIRNCINAGNLTEAERLIAEVDHADRGAEWTFLMGCIQMRKGFYVDARRSFDEAYRMEPTNNEYWQAKEHMNRNANSFGNGYNTTRSGGCDGCDVCSTMLCADCCCECMGGDLIPCC